MSNWLERAEEFEKNNLRVDSSRVEATRNLDALEKFYLELFASLEISRKLEEISKEVIGKPCVAEQLCIKHLASYDVTKYYPGDGYSEARGFINWGTSKGIHQSKFNPNIYYFGEVFLQIRIQAEIPLERDTVSITYDSGNKDGWNYSTAVVGSTPYTIKMKASSITEISTRANTLLNTPNPVINIEDVIRYHEEENGANYRIPIFKGGTTALGRNYNLKVFSNNLEELLVECCGKRISKDLTFNGILGKEPKDLYKFITGFGHLECLFD